MIGDFTSSMSGLVVQTTKHLVPTNAGISSTSNTFSMPSLVNVNNTMVDNGTLGQETSTTCNDEEMYRLFTNVV
jgi:hypothetical protein